MDLGDLNKYITYSVNEKGYNVVQFPRYIWELFIASQNGEERRAELRKWIQRWMNEPPLGDEAWWEEYEKTTQRHRSVVTEGLFTVKEQEALESVAQRRGFPKLREYIRTLIAEDIQHRDEKLPLLEDADEKAVNVQESFRRGWSQAVRGETLTEEGFWEAVSKDK